MEQDPGVFFLNAAVARRLSGQTVQFRQRFVRLPQGRGRLGAQERKRLSLGLVQSIDLLSYQVRCALCQRRQVATNVRRSGFS